MRILFTVMPAAGHLHPTIPIAQTLQQRGHQVHYATGAGKLKVLQQAGLAATAILPGRADTPEQMNAPIAAWVGSYNPRHLYGQIAYLLDLLGDALQELHALADVFRPQVVVADFSTPVGAALARTRGLPWVTTTNVPACIRTTRGTPAFMGGLARARHSGHRRRDALLRGIQDWFRNSLDWLFRARLRRLGLRINLPGGGDGLYSPHAILALSPAVFEYPRDWPPALRFLGPIAWSDAPDLDPVLQTWLAQAPRPRTFVTLGTHLAAEKTTTLPGLTNGLLAEGGSVLLNLGGSTDSNDVRPRLVQNTRLNIIDYANYEQVLPQVERVVHHGGAGISFATVAAGKAALALPQGFDQFDNAQRLAELGLALRLDPSQVTARRVQGALRHLAEPAFATRAEALAPHFQQDPQAVARAAEVVEQVGNTNPRG